LVDFLRSECVRVSVGGREVVRALYQYQMHHRQPHYQESHCRDGKVVADVEVLLSELAHDKAQCHERLSEPREDPCYHYRDFCVVRHVADRRSCWTLHTTTR
jgi:hypothetical protein